MKEDARLPAGLAGADDVLGDHGHGDVRAARDAEQGDRDLPAAALGNGEPGRVGTARRRGSPAFNTGVDGGWRKLTWAPAFATIFGASRRRSRTICLRPASPYRRSKGDRTVAGSTCPAGRSPGTCRAGAGGTGSLPPELLRPASGAADPVRDR